LVSDLNKISSAKCGQNTLRMAPIFEDGNNKKDRPREGDLFDRSSLGASEKTKESFILDLFYPSQVYTYGY